MIERQRQEVVSAMMLLWASREFDDAESDEECGTLIADALLPFLVAAERGGYERCKRDATTRIEAIPDKRVYERGLFEAVLAVVAALNAAQQEAGDGTR